LAAPGSIEENSPITVALTTAEVQTWIAVVGGLATAILGILKYFNFRSRRERATAVGQAFAATVDALASTDPARQFAGAILLRRFFDQRTEQGEGDSPYEKEAVAVIAALLRDIAAGNLQKLLADGLGYAPTLEHADLQRCNLQHAYLGVRPDRGVDLSNADLFEADLTGASLKGARAHGTVFFRAVLRETVLRDSDLTGADFRAANLEGARFDGADLSGARFDGAKAIPPEVIALLGDDRRVPPASASSVPVPSGR
jgi:Pentapeptide repeats (8 copies)